MKKLITGFILSLLIVSQSCAFDLWQGAGLGFANSIVGLPGASAQTAFLPFDSSLGTATFVRNGGAVNPDTGLWANENLCLQSEVAGTTWTQTNVTIAANSIAAPDGNITADTLTAAADNATWVQTPTANQLVDKTWSIYVKRKTGTGAISLSLDGGSTYTAVTVTADWTRVSITQAIAAHSLVLKISTNTDAVYVWGSQLQRGPIGPYLATTTAAKYDQPRYVTGKDGTAAHALLVEESSTNLILQSNTFNTTWIKDSTNTLNAADAFGIANSAWTIEDSSAAAVQSFYQQVTAGSLTAGQTYTSSVYVKKTVGATTYPSFNLASASFTRGGGCVIDTNNGIAVAHATRTGSTIDPTTVSVDTVGDFIRVKLSVTVGATGIYYAQFIPAGMSSVTTSGNTTASLLGSTIIHGFQIGLMPYATSYIPTTTAAVTRAAEYATQATSGIVTQDATATIQGWWKPEGVAAGKTQTIWSTYTGAADYTRLVYSGTALVFTKAKTGQATETISHTVTITPNTWYHAAVTIAADGTALMYHNGSLVGTNGTTTAFKPVIATNMQYGAFNGTLQINGSLDYSRFFNRVMTASEIARYYNKGL